MGILTALKDWFVPKSYPQTEFGVENLRFFCALLRACPAGSRLTFDQSEPESFVQAFRRWSFRENAKSFEADYYTIDDEFIASIEERAKGGQLELYAHFGIASAEGELLCASWDDFMIVKLADGVREKVGALLRA